MITIENRSDFFKITSELERIIKDCIRISLKNENFITESELNLILTDDKEIRVINKEQRNIDKSTDVLSFPMLEMKNGKLFSDNGDYDLETNCILLGDIVLSVETAKRQSEEYGHSFEREIGFLITHGIFHLLGYDHQNEKQEEIMLRKQEKVLEEVGLKR